ncbi:MAG: hypothetical protein IJA48_08080 [Oscillospiraceae bacterium]|nr:hypothetical protein [Oscillospiraceae bacterium]
MNEWNLFEALGEIEDPLLSPPKQKHFPWKKNGLRVALIAAVLSLLAGTVLAVGIGVGVRYGEQTVTLEGISLSQDAAQNLSYHTAQIQYELRTVTTSAQSYLTQALTAAWEQHGGEGLYDLKNPDGSLRNFGTVAEAEQFFGIDLMDSPELSELIRGVYVTMVVADSAQAAACDAQGGPISPDGLLIYLSLRRGELSDTALDARLVGEAGITVFVPLTEAFVQSQREQTLYSHDSPFAESGLMTAEGRSLLLLEDSSSSLGQVGYAAWCDNGLGYLAHLKTYPQGYATPLSLLAPLLGRIH